MLIQLGRLAVKSYKNTNGKRFTTIEKHYPTVSKDWIKNLPVQDISQNDCALFLWTTDAHIEEAIETINAWQFKYKTIAFVWEKKPNMEKLLLI